MTVSWDLLTPQQKILLEVAKERYAKYGQGYITFFDVSKVYVDRRYGRLALQRLTALGWILPDHRERFNLTERGINEVEKEIAQSNGIVKETKITDFAVTKSE